MDELIEQIISESPSSGPFRNYYFQPQLISVSSDSAQSTTISQNPNQECFYNQYTVVLPRPALDVKSIQLIRASIPNPQTCIPDTETIFFYYKVQATDLSPVVNTSNIFTLGNLHMVRLLPSWYKQELNANSYLYGFNKTFADYEALNDELKKSCLNDPINTFSSLFVPGDISLTYDISSNKFKFTGNLGFINDVWTYSYVSAGYNDPVVQQAQLLLQQQSQEFDSYGPYPPQTFQLYKTLNLRLGFTWDGSNLNLLTPALNAVNEVLAYRFRPPVGFILGLGGIPENETYTAEAYANLVFTNSVNLYASFISGASTDTLQNTNLLGVVPMNCQNLGVSFYNPVIPNPLTRIIDQIYEISIQLTTDTGAPYNLPNSAITSIELSLTY
jgi:hypothetical protein